MSKKSSLTVFSLLSLFIMLMILGCNGFFPFPEPTTYTITAIAGENGKITSEGKITLIEGEGQSFTITPDEGYKISEVIIDGESIGAVTEYTFTDVRQDHTIQVSFQKKPQPVPTVTIKNYTITSTAATGGTINPSGEITVTEGEEQNFTITPDNGYIISDVLVDDVSVGKVTEYAFTDIQANHTIEAFFIQQFTITATAGDNGSIESEGEITLLKGESQTFTITPDICYQIKKLTVNGTEETEVGTSYTINNIQQDYSIEVSFILSDKKIRRYNKDEELQNDEYSSIQAAINDSFEGDTIIVCPGTYNENLVIDGKNITVKSADPSDPDTVASTIIDGDIDEDEIGDGSVVSFINGDTSTLEGFTIQNGNAEYGGGIYVSSSSPSIFSNTIKSNKVSGLFSCGGAIYANNSTPNIENNNITINTANDYCGGGICLESCILIDTDNKIFNNTISDNKAKYGGGIILLNSSAEISENRILDNSATYGGGNYIANDSNVLMENNTITGNIALSYDGGGIFVKNSSLVMNNNDINYNKAESHRGGGIYIESGTDISIKKNTVQYNEADFGGGIYITQISPVLSENTIQYNTAKSYGGGIFVDPFSDIMPDNIRTAGWGSSEDDDYRENIPTVVLNDPLEDVEYNIADNTFLGNKHDYDEEILEDTQYTEGAHVYFH